MITINAAKGPIKVECWEDVLERAGFTPNLDPTQHKLDSVIGRYVFGDMVKCGLSNCHTQHARGYIVATTSGLETNIGKDCGKRYFGLDFDHMAKQFDIDMTAYENRDILWSFSFQVEELEEKITALRTTNKGADWVNKNASALMNPAKLPLPITRQLSKLVKQRSGTYTVDREANPEELDEMEAKAGRKLIRPQYVTDYEVNIRGIEALYPENNLRELLVLQLLDELKAFKELAIDNLSNTQLSRWKMWATSVDLTLEKAIVSIEYGRVLLIKENLEPLSRLENLNANGELERFLAFLEQLS
ncbi:hypothetical protein ACIPEN_03000 [Herbaspirillum chlorophenolicum]|uniref:Uncharacterized protein n=1 Tax=Herbaspirillum chlorophenolicum TaxID=211589 RepID=A0ABW8EWT1_9BURK